MQFIRQIALAILLGFSAVVWSQVVTATLQGTIVDPNGALVPNATVTATNANRGTSISRKADDSGLVTMTSMPPGDYTITVEAPGFKTLTRSGLNLSAGAEARLTLQLEVGAVSEKIVVTAEAPLINTANAEQRTNLEEIRIKNLPAIRRDWTNFLALNTGVNVSGGNVRMNGLPGASFRLTVDGTDATQDNEQPSLSMTGNFNFIKGVATEAIAEVNVAKGIASAEISNTMSGNVNIITKSGTNSFHGSAFWLNNLEDYNARNQFLASKPGLVYNQWGGSIGGPILRNKAFFFGAYEGYRQRGFQALNEQVPTREFRARISAATNRYDKLFSIYPLPNQSYNANMNTGAWVGSGTEQGSDDHAVIRGDYNFNPTNLLNVRYTRARPFRLTPRVVSVNNRTWEGTIEQGTANYTHVRPTWTFETRFGYNYNFVPRNDNYYARYEQDVAFNAITGLGFSVSAETLVREGYTWSLEQSVAKVVGRHAIKFGGIWFRPHVRRDNTEVPVLTYSSIQDMIDNIPNAGRVTLGVDEYDLRTFTLGFFVQDDFRVNNKLTINAGIRYDYFGVPKERDGRLFNRAQPFGTGAYTPPDRVWEPNRRNFAPRIGFAYQFAPRTVLRGGAGMFYSPLPLYAGGVDIVRNAVDEPFRLLYNRTEAISAGQVLRWPVSNDAVRRFIKGAPSLIGDTAVNTDLPQPFSYQWNLNVQRELPWGFAMETGYVGTRGVHLQMVRFWNQVDRITGVRPYPGFTAFRYRDASDSSAYHSWQTSIRKRFSAGLSLGVNDTWASAYSYSSDADLLLPTQVQNIFDVAADKSVPGDFVRHNFVTDFVYELPLQRLTQSKALLARNLLGGWQIAGIFTARTAGPVNPAQETPLEGSRADYIGGQPYFDNYTTTLLRLNRGAYGLVPIGSVSGVPVRPGTAGRHSLWGAGWNSLDAAIAKRFFLTEKLNGKFEAQMANAFNKTNFSGLENRVSRANFGQFTSTRGARVMQLNLRLDF
jgi:hypothetical protein